MIISTYTPLGIRDACLSCNASCIPSKNEVLIHAIDCVGIDRWNYTLLHDARIEKAVDDAWEKFKP